MQQFKSNFIIRRVLKEAKIPWYRVNYKLLDEKEWVALTRSLCYYCERFGFLKEIKKESDQFLMEYFKN